MFLTNMNDITDLERPMQKKEHDVIGNKNSGHLFANYVNLFICFSQWISPAECNDNFNTQGYIYNQTEPKCNTVLYQAVGLFHS